METDIVVMGSGATGLSAAVTAAESGAKVVLFEKQRSLGGTSNFFQGTFAVESDMQRQRYITYSRDEAFKGIMEYSHWRANPRIVRAIVNESRETIAWLQQEGIAFTDATINMPNAPRTYHTIKGYGETFVKTLVTKAKEQGVDIKLGAPVKRIVMKGRRINGVIAEQDGAETEVGAKALIIASGGYANNKEWIKRYSGFDLGVNLFPLGNVDKMGDGIRMAWEAGAAEENIGTLELFARGPVGPEFALGNPLEIAATQPDLWVDAQGERYCDEFIGFYDSSTGNASARQKAPFTYRLFDDSIKESLLVEGIHRNAGMDNPPGSRPLHLDKELAAALERKSTEVFAAGTVEELAVKMKADPATLASTVREYNAFCEKGHDDLFAKDRKYLRPLKGPTFYAIRARTVCLGTLGGIRINHRMEVVDKKGVPIPGLYAGGFDAGGMWGDSYSINASSGLSSSFAINSGRIAGRNAMAYLRGFSDEEA